MRADNQILLLQEDRYQLGTIKIFQEQRIIRSLPKNFLNNSDLLFTKNKGPKLGKTDSWEYFFWPQIRKREAVHQSMGRQLGKESIHRPAPARNFLCRKNGGHRGKISVVDMACLVFIEALSLPLAWKGFL